MLQVALEKSESCLSRVIVNDQDITDQDLGERLYKSVKGQLLVIDTSLGPLYWKIEHNVGNYLYSYI